MLCAGVDVRSLKSEFLPGAQNLLSLGLTSLDGSSGYLKTLLAAFLPEVVCPDAFPTSQRQSKSKIYENI